MSDIRVGLGVDFHRFERERRLVLGGVSIEHELGLAGHSDADVLTHALCDALLGAASLGDIGTHFPDDDPRYEGVRSIALLKEVISLLAQESYRPINVDCSVIAEQPRLSPYAAAIRGELAKAVGLASGSVGLKFTTSEGMGALGRSEGIGAFCVCLIERD